MPPRAVIAHYLLDFREQRESFGSIPDALQFLRTRSIDDGVIVDKVALSSGTVVLSRGDIEQLLEPRPAIPAPPAFKPQSATPLRLRLASLFV